MKSKVTHGLDMQAAAKELAVKGGRNGLYKLLRTLKIFDSNNKPHHRYVRLGYFHLQTRSFSRGDVEHQYCKPMVTGTGITWLQEQINENN